MICLPFFETEQLEKTGEEQLQSFGSMRHLFAPYPALRLLLFVVAGIVTGSASLISLEGWLALALLLIVSLALALCLEFFYRKGASFPHVATSVFYLLFVCTVFAALSHYRFNTLPERNLLRYTGSTLVLYGRVATRPVSYEKGIGWTMDVQEVFFHGRTVRLADRARVFVRGASGGTMPELRSGDLVRLKGSLRLIPGAANRGEFDPRRHARMERVFVQLYCAGPWHLEHTGRSSLTGFERHVVTPVYKYIVASVDQLVPEGSERKLVRGVLLGEREVLDREVFEAFRITGTAHVLAVSGLNVGLLALGIHVLLQRVRVTLAGRWFSFALFGFVLLVFSFVTGNSPSVKRAAIMSLVLFGGQTLGKRSYGLNSLAVSDIVILLFDPLDLFNPGFLMTNAAVLGILFVSPFLSRHHADEGFAGMFLRLLSGSFLVTVAAVVGVSPVVAYYFGTFSLVGLVANLPVVFFSTLMMYALMPMIFFNLFASSIAGLFATSAWLFARLTLQAAMFFSSSPFASIPLRPDGVDLFVYYGSVLVAAWFFTRHEWGRLLMTLLLGMNLLLWRGVLSPAEQSDGLVTVNLGRAVALLYATRSETVIIDAGRNVRDSSRILRQLNGHGLPPPVATVQFFSPDSVFSAFPVSLHMNDTQKQLRLPTMVVTRPMEKVLLVRSRNRSMLYVSGISRLRKLPAWKADVVILTVYRFREKQRLEMESWLGYVRPKRCVVLFGSFLTERERTALFRFAAGRPDMDVRRPDRQIVIR